MNSVERKQFWDMLCSLKGEDINYEAQQLSGKIVRPEMIYRFRPVTNNSLESLRTNTIYFSTADHYDDPFDSYSHIDWDLVNKQIQLECNDVLKLQAKAEMLQSVINIPAETIKANFKAFSIDQWSYITVNFLKEVVIKEIQKRQLSICFSERYNNEVLWLKYASEHRGFALEYHISDDFLVMQYKNVKDSYFLYPIYYSNEKYDATEYAKKIAYELIALTTNSKVQELILNGLPVMNWSYERIGLIKHKCHEYDEEWRMFYPFILPSHEIIKQRPKIIRRPESVIIGIRTGQSEKNLIISLAKEAGISKIYQLEIDNSGELVRQLIS